MKQKGFSPLLMIVLVGILVMVGVVAYIFMTTRPSQQISPMPLSSAIPSPSASPDQNATSSGSLNSEINSLIITDVDGQFTEVDTDISTL